MLRFRQWLFSKDEYITHQVVISIPDSVEIRQMTVFGVFRRGLSEVFSSGTCWCLSENWSAEQSVFVSDQGFGTVPQEHNQRAFSKYETAGLHKKDCEKRPSGESWSFFYRANHNGDYSSRDFDSK
ncbi:hypothetical protein A6X21_21640 [Planctopirus hydrillae]|uniref:Uncharacterized protein n=1 Tax=Planctopirus hydrillae TaxID=1841610 RepID=A0A1C3EFY1_9PLAN|nr:hypothetical protein A6X21_21640 [Planctopirus hydrillae]